MKVNLEIHSIDWENRSTHFLDNVVVEGDPSSIIYELSGFLINGEGEYQIVIKSMKVS